MSAGLTGPMHLRDAENLHRRLVELEAEIKEVRAERDVSIRAAIDPDTPQSMTMYAASQNLDVPQQTIARIRDRG